MKHFKADGRVYVYRKFTLINFKNVYSVSFGRDADTGGKVKLIVNGEAVGDYVSLTEIIDIMEEAQRIMKTY